ncbi:hypothetical protein AB9M75_08025 [Lactobacillus sp. AN1001]
MPRTKTRMADANKLTVTHTDANGKPFENDGSVILPPHESLFVYEVAVKDKQKKAGAI